MDNFWGNREVLFFTLLEHYGVIFNKIRNIEILRQLQAGILRDQKIPARMLVCCNYSEGSIPRGVLAYFLPKSRDIQKLYKTDG